MAAQADDVTQVEKFEKFELRWAHHVELHVELQASAVAQDMAERGFSMRPQRDDSPRYAHLDVIRGEFFGSPRAEFLRNLFSRVCPIEFMRVRGVPQRFDFA